MIIDVDKQAAARVGRRQIWLRKQNGDGPREWRIFVAGVGLAENSCDQLIPFDVKNAKIFKPINARNYVLTVLSEWIHTAAHKVDLFHLNNKLVRKVHIKSISR